jgi:O-acetyl-ADP-ribose deacetylase
MNEVFYRHSFGTGQQLEVGRGDITSEAVDAIVNAANRHLQHGGGVAGVIAAKGGKVIQAESDAWVAKNGPVSHSEPAYTSAGRLSCRYVLHAVGPVWGEGDEDEKLAQAITGVLRLANRLKLTSLSLPAISTGIYGFPKERAANIILEEIASYFSGNPHSGLKRVRLILYDQATFDAFEQAFVKRFQESGRL